jgi:membrane protein DedA with SNARE-associated domain
MIRDFLATYGYAAVVVGTALEGETVLIAAGFAAHRGYLSLPWVIASAFVGSFGGDQLYFFLGRRYGRRMVDWRPAWRARVATVNRWLERWSTLFVLGFRFLYGLRTVSPLVISLTRISARRFVLLNGCGAALWAVAFATAGYLFGAVIEASLSRAERHEGVILATLAVIGAAMWGIHHLWSTRQARRLISRTSPKGSVEADGEPRPRPVAQR